MHTKLDEKEIPMDVGSMYIGMPIGFSHHEKTKHGLEVLACMMEDARTIGQSKMKITQKMSALKMFAFPRIDYQMMFADLGRRHLERCDALIWRIVGEWFSMNTIPVEHSQVPCRYSLFGLQGKSLSMSTGSASLSSAYRDANARSGDHGYKPQTLSLFMETTSEHDQEMRTPPRRL
jgi:hypothetical protein